MSEKSIRKQGGGRVIAKTWLYSLFEALQGMGSTDCEDSSEPELYTSSRYWEGGLDFSWRAT